MWLLFISGCDSPTVKVIPFAEAMQLLPNNAVVPSTTQLFETSVQDKYVCWIADRVEKPAAKVLHTLTDLFETHETPYPRLLAEAVVSSLATEGFEINSRKD